MPSVGELIRRARLENDMTQAELAESLGVAPSRIAAFEEDEETPTPDQIGEMESVLGLASGQLLNEAGIVEGP